MRRSLGSTEARESNPTGFVSQSSNLRVLSDSDFEFSPLGVGDAERPWIFLTKAVMLKVGGEQPSAAPNPTRGVRTLVVRSTRPVWGACALATERSRE